ncbi:MAG TPA: hypothetical protein VMU50_18445 [Polyangia bacterium]|nr:hypothetical protein [Polyangia bacterium]
MRWLERSRRRGWARLRAWTPLLFLVGCGNVTPYGPGGSGGGAGTGGIPASGSGGNGTGGSGTGGALGTGGATEADGGSAAHCPAREPSDGALCVREGAVCEYGSDPRGDACRVFASCTSLRWAVTKPDPAGCPPFTDAGMCPKTPAGTACAAHDAYCSLADGRSCHCTNCSDGPVALCALDWAWHCQAMNTTAGCPAAPPDIGSSCLDDGAMCSYGCRMMNRRCDHGVWVGAGEGACPVSTRKAKRDIRYLTADDIRDLAEQIQKMRLATYAYRNDLAYPSPDGGASGRRHLGFVIEDDPDNPAVDRDHDMIDLYGYTSMLLAATQQQRREIDDLRRQLRALKAEIAGPPHRRGR